MSEAVKNLTENVANGIGGEGAVYVAKSYAEIICPPKESDKTADEVIDDIKQKLREYE